MKKFGWPPDNKRLFIRAWQMVDGWEDRVGMWQGSVLTPTPASAALARKAGRARGSKAGRARGSKAGRARGSKG